MSDFDRGVLNASDPTYLDELHFAQHWHLDPTCNWKEFTQNVYTTPTSELIQQRTHDAGIMVEFPTLDDPSSSRHLSTLKANEYGISNTGGSLGKHGS